MDIDLTPRLGLEFECLEEAWQFWTDYGGRMGFGVRKHNFNKSSKDGSITCYRYVCCKQGVRRPDKRDYKTAHPRPETRTGCQTKMTIKKVNGKYRITEFINEHNHPLHLPESVHLLASQRKINEVQAYELEMAKDAGLQPKASFDLMSRHAGGRANLGYTIEDARNYLHSRRQREMVYGEAGCLLRYFQQQLTDNPSFYHAYQMDSEEQITNVFWVDAQMLIDYACFGDVVLLDTTYCTNSEHRPLAIFSGFNHYREAVIFGAALLYDETIESFKWLFETFLHANKQKLPSTIFIDQDQAMARALQEVMPDVKHGLCTFHIRRNGIKHLGNLMKDESHFLTEFNDCMYRYIEENEFEDAWKKLLEKYNVEENSWLSSIYQLKEKWAACYMKKFLTLGMRSTQLSESVNSALKGCMKPNLHINEFFKQFEKVIDLKRYKELKRDFEMREKLPRLVMQSSTILRQVSKIYTHTVFDNLFQREWDLSIACRIKERDETEFVYQYVIRVVGERGEWSVNYDTCDGSINCSCRKFEQCGLLCCHILRIYIHLDIDEIPEKYIVKRWTREARSEIVHDVKGNEVQADPRKEISIRYKQLCPMLLRLASKASKCPEAFSVVHQGILELNKKVSEILGMCVSLEGETSTKIIPECDEQGIGFKKKEGKQRKKRMKSWVDDLRNRKRNVKPSQELKDSETQISQENSNLAPQQVKKRRKKVKSSQISQVLEAQPIQENPHSASHQINLEPEIMVTQISQEISSSTSLMPFAPLAPEEVYACHNVDGSHMTFTSLLMATFDSNLESLEAQNLSQTLPHGS